MLQLASYVDETGHAQDGLLKYTGMAGFVAPRIVWTRFGKRWRSVCKEAGLTQPFHMKDFAHSVGQFATWKGQEPRRRALFNELVSLIVETGATPVGAIVSSADFQSLTLAQQSSFRDPYFIAFQTGTRGLALEALHEHKFEKVQMYYAFQSEFSSGAKQLWEAMKATWDHGRLVGSFHLSSPESCVQMQAADLFAYELRKEFANRVDRPDDPMRWGLSQILKLQPIPLPKIQLFDRKELLRVIKESQFPDQSFVEEVLQTQMVSAMESMVKWVRTRGNFDAR